MSFFPPPVVGYVLFKRYSSGITDVQFTPKGEDLTFRGERNEHNTINKCRRMNPKSLRKTNWCFY